MKRRIGFALATAVLAWAAIEGVSCVAFNSLEKEPFSFALMKQRRSAAAGSAAEADAPWVYNAQVVHPYLGTVYSYEPKRHRGIEERFPISRHGFSDKADPFFLRSADRVIVGVLGGSVAGVFAAEGVEALATELKRDPRFKDKELVFVNVALGGHKQPQQLMTLTYLLAQGAEFDVVLNIDGFNEVALYPVENAENGIYPWFPREWHHRVEQLAEPELAREVGRVALLKEARENWARAFGRFPLRVSVFFSFVWQRRDRLFEASITKGQWKIQHHKSRKLSFEATGPGAHFSSDGQMYQELTRIWKRCSLELAVLCRGHGIAYFHFLQPNQYAAPGKPMSALERETAIRESSPYRLGVIAGYPGLEAASRELVAAGVNFEDLTGIFADYAAPLYTDSCCHFNAAGNAIMAKRIAAKILKTPSTTHAGS